MTFQSVGLSRNSKGISVLVLIAAVSLRNLFLNWGRLLILFKRGKCSVELDKL